MTRVFSTLTSLSTIPTTRHEIQRLVLAFLEARAKIIPKPLRPQPSHGAAEEESQEYFTGLDQIDFSDPALAAALEEPSQTAKLDLYEQETCKVTVSSPL